MLFESFGEAPKAQISMSPKPMAVGSLVSCTLIPGLSSKKRTERKRYKASAARVHLVGRILKISEVIENTSTPKRLVIFFEPVDMGNSKIIDRKWFRICELQ